MTRKKIARVGRTGGAGFCTLLTTVFVILKGTGNLSMSWFWVFSPLWIPFVWVLLVMLFVFTIALILDR